MNVQPLLCIPWRCKCNTNPQQGQVHLGCDLTTGTHKHPCKASTMGFYPILTWWALMSFTLVFLHPGYYMYSPGSTLFNRTLMSVVWGTTCRCPRLLCWPPSPPEVPELCQWPHTAVDPDNPSAASLPGSDPSMPGESRPEDRETRER